jgi:phosphoribosylaminoimidazole (AIR) synthetase
MYHTFNMGVGMVLIVDPKNAEAALNTHEITTFEPRVIGRVVKGAGKVILEY